MFWNEEAPGWSKTFTATLRIKHVLRVQILS